MQHGWQHDGFEAPGKHFRDRRLSLPWVLAVRGFRFCDFRLQPWDISAQLGISNGGSLRGRCRYCKCARARKQLEPRENNEVDRALGNNLNQSREKNNKYSCLHVKREIRILHWLRMLQVTSGLYEGETAIFFMIAQHSDSMVKNLLEETPQMWVCWNALFLWVSEVKRLYVLWNTQLKIVVMSAGWIGNSRDSFCDPGLIDVNVSVIWKINYYHLSG